ncbi:MAG: MarR family winged helix-turn-helix transcriptional regulator [Rickettsiales bacterium]
MVGAFDRDEQESDRRAKIIVGIERLSTLFRAILWEEAKMYRLSPLQMQILLFISYHDIEQCNVTTISKEFAVTKATVSDAVKSLLEKELLKKQGGEDARGFSLSLSRDGKKYVKKLSPFTDFFAKSFDKASEEEIGKMWEGMLLLIGYLQNTDVIPVRMCFSCKNFGKEHPKGKPHYCHLMQKPLKINDIRLDCAEYSGI